MHVERPQAPDGWCLRVLVRVQPADANASLLSAWMRCEQSFSRPIKSVVTGTPIRDQTIQKDEILTSGMRRMGFICGGKTWFGASVSSQWDA